jgi:signal transduction histidine kinase
VAIVTAVHGYLLPADSGPTVRWGVFAGLSLRARVVLLAVAGIVPMLAFSLGSQYLQYREAVANAGHQALELARSLSVVVDQELHARIVALQVLSASRAVQDNDLVTFRARAETLVAQQFPGSNVILLRHDGQQLMNTILPPGAPLPFRPNLETTRRVFATGEPAVSNLYQGAVGPRPVVAIDVPVKRDDGTVIYVLSINPRLEDFAEVIRKQKLPAGRVVSLSDQRGVLVARTPNPDRFVGQPAGSGLLERMMVEREGIFEGTSREGIPAVAAFSHSEGFGWTIGIGVPRSEMTAPALRAAVLTLTAGGVLLAISLALALLVARHITGPIASLRRLASGVGPEALFEAPTTGLREADDVVQALRAAENSRRRSKHDEQHARAALTASEEKLRQSQKMEALGQLTGGLAHDFNNLLLVIIGSLDLLLESRIGGDEVRQFAEEASAAALRGADLTRSLLAFARKQPLRPQHVSLNELVGGITRLLSRTLGERIEVTLNLAPDLWPVVVDPAQLETALTNLATNARDAMPKGGRLTIATANRQLDEEYASQYAEVTPGDYAVIKVTDSGTGIPPAVMAKIFDPFFTTKARGEGTGLGLSMVFGFMKQSGGHINVYSEPGVGTTFRMYLPRDRHEAYATLREVEAPATAPSGGETILVVEDNPQISRLAVLQLTTLGYKVKQSQNAADALAMLEQGEPIDLLFADVIMPGRLDGYDLARIVRERWPSIVIVLTSGFPGANDHRDTAELSDLPLLTKPYRREDLAQMLHDAIEDRKG